MAKLATELYSSQGTNGRRHESRVYGGGFYFDRDEALEKVTGPRARIEWRVDDVIAAMPESRLTLEAEYSNDHSRIDSRADRWEFGARLRIPFGGRSRAGALRLPDSARVAHG